MADCRAPYFVVVGNKKIADEYVFSTKHRGTAVTLGTFSLSLGEMRYPEGNIGITLGYYNL